MLWATVMDATERLVPFAGHRRQGSWGTERFPRGLDAGVRSAAQDAEQISTQRDVDPTRHGWKPDGGGCGVSLPSRKRCDLWSLVTLR